MKVLAELARRYPEVELVVEAWEGQDYFALAGGSPAGSSELRLWEVPLDDDTRPLPAGWPACVQQVAVGAAGDDVLAGLPVITLAI